MDRVYKYEQGGDTSKGDHKLVLPRESEGEVLRTEDGREYVMYRNEQTGEMVKVFGSWNEAPRVRERDEQGMGRFMAIDTSFNYPVTQNENGEFILDESMLDTEQEGDGPTMVYDPEHGRKMPVAPVGNLLKQLEQQREGYSGIDKFSPTVRRGIGMERGGRTYSYGGRTEDELTTNNPNGDTTPSKPKVKPVSDFNREDYKWADDLLDLSGVIKRSNKNVDRLANDPEYAFDFASAVDVERRQYDDLVDELRNAYGIKPGMKWEDLEGYEGSELQELIRYLAPRRNELNSFVSKAMSRVKN